MLDLSNFPGGRIDVPKAPKGLGCGERVSPPHWGRGLGRIFLVFDLKMVNFGFEP